MKRAYKGDLIPLVHGKIKSIKDIFTVKFFGKAVYGENAFSALPLGGKSDKGEAPGRWFYVVNGQFVDLFLP